MGLKAKPAHVFKLGRIRATIWANRTEDNSPWFNVTISRLYKDGDRWKDADSFGHDDLPIVAKAADMAYTWIWRRQLAADQMEKMAKRQ